MSKLLWSGVLIVLLTASLPDRPCTCRTALETERAHGANELIEYSETTVKRIRGRVAYSDDTPVGDVVVEIYDITSADRKLKVHEVGQRQRRTACVTSNDGSFCFPDLPSGRYVMRVGTRSASGGMNEVFWKVNVDRRWWRSWLRRERKLNVTLSPGT